MGFNDVPIFEVDEDSVGDVDFYDYGEEEDEDGADEDDDESDEDEEESDDSDEDNDDDYSADDEAGKKILELNYFTFPNFFTLWSGVWRSC